MTAKTRRYFTFTFKKKAVKKALSDTETVNSVAAEFDLREGLLRRWLHDYQDHGDAGLKSKRKGRKKQSDQVVPSADNPPNRSVISLNLAEEPVVAKLYQVVGRLTMENQDMRERLDGRR